jgi:hypothetical protein
MLTVKQLTELLEQEINKEDFYIDEKVSHYTIEDIPYLLELIGHARLLRQDMNYLLVALKKQEEDTKTK